MSIQSTSQAFTFAPPLLFAEPDSTSRSTCLKKFIHYIKLIFDKFIKLIKKFLEYTSLRRKFYLTRQATYCLAQDIFAEHYTYKNLNADILKRIIIKFIKFIDPHKYIFRKNEIKPFVDPSDETIKKGLQEFAKKKFSLFYEIYDVYLNAVKRAEALKTKLLKRALPSVKEQKSKAVEDFPETKAQQINSLSLELVRREKRIQKYKKEAQPFVRKVQALEESYRLNREKFSFSFQKIKKVHELFLKALCRSLDKHSRYLTAEEVKDELLAEANQPTSWHIEKQKIIQKAKINAGSHQETEKVIKAFSTRCKTVNKNRASVKRISISNRDILHIRIHSFEYRSDINLTAQIKNELQEQKRNICGVLLDLRGNLGGSSSVSNDVLELFLNRGPTEQTIYADSRIFYRVSLEDAAWNGPLLVLVDKFSASASEKIATILSDYKRAIVIGDNHTYGKGCGQGRSFSKTNCSFGLKYGGYHVTNNMFFGPSGSSPQLEGVKSDIVIPGPYNHLKIGLKYDNETLPAKKIAPFFIPDLKKKEEWSHYIERNFMANPQRRGSIQEKLVKLQESSKKRIAANQRYQTFLESPEYRIPIPEEIIQEGQDLQLTEAFNVMKEFILIYDK